MSFLTTRPSFKRLKRFDMLLGIAHAILPIPWSIPPFPAYPTPHSTESPARTARLILFREFMRNHRVNNLLVGHHLDDQVENKLTRGYGMGMRVCMDGREVDGEYGGKKWMMRPLLSFTKVGSSFLVLGSHLF